MNTRPHSGPSGTTLPTRQPASKPAGFSSPRKLSKDPQTNAPTTRQEGPSVYQTPAVPPPQEEAFDPASLLGRTYTRRQQATQKQSLRSHTDPPLSLPITNSRNQSPSKSTAPNGLKRGSSTRQKPKPLVDLTPVYQEPPQHSKKGRGVIPSQIPAGGLVEVATSPENPLDAPPATTWRKPNIQPPPLPSPSTYETAFTGGLLGRSGTKRR